LAERERIDVAVVDYQLGSRSGLWLSRMLKRLDPPPRVVIYSAYCDGPLSAACVVAEAEVAATLGMSRAGLDSRMWAMLHKLEGLSSDPVGPRPFGAPSLRPRRR
jgi:hypothetical protein